MNRKAKNEGYAGGSMDLFVCVCVCEFCFHFVYIENVLCQMINTFRST